jgi:hypothetical protein
MIKKEYTSVISLKEKYKKIQNEKWDNSLIVLSQSNCFGTLIKVIKIRKFYILNIIFYIF